MRLLRTFARGFSLMELIVVIAIISILTAVAVPAISSLINGPVLDQASQILTNQLSLARQYAATKNRAIEVRFLRFADPEMPGEKLNAGQLGHFRALQLLEVLENGVTSPVGKVEYLPRAVVFASDARSSLLDGEGPTDQALVGAVASQDVEMPRGLQHDYRYVAFRFQPNGSTTLAANLNWYVTVLSLQDQLASRNLPSNYVVLQIDPVSGTTRSFRPGLK